MTKDTKCAVCGKWYNNYHHPYCPDHPQEDREARLEIRDRANQAIVNLQYARVRALLKPTKTED